MPIGTLKGEGACLGSGTEGIVCGSAAMLRASEFGLYRNLTLSSNALPLNLDGSCGKGSELVIPCHAALSRSRSFDDSSKTIPATLPFLRIENRTATIPLFLIGALATSGTSRYQFVLIA